MPQLMKGGKYIFGWSKVRPDGMMRIPPEAVCEYGLESGERVILLPGSRASGGFSVVRAEKLAQSPLGSILEDNPQLARFECSQGEGLEIDGKLYCWVEVRDGTITIPIETLAKYGITIEDHLLVGRGSLCTLEDKQEG
jgi:hypothetical protein